MINRPMRNPKQPSVAHLEQRCAAWNAAYPIGTVVEYHSIIGDARHLLTRTNSVAYVLSGHTAVLFVDGIRGCVALDAVVPANKRRGVSKAATR